MKRVGIDLGSRKVKIAITDGNDDYEFHSFDTIPFYKQFGGINEGKLTIDFAALALFSQDEDVSIVVTGYGRNTIDLAGSKVISEIKAHVAGAKSQTGLDNFTMVDLGGQDSKVALVKEGILADFTMNDKCAASSGRYLENMASILEVSLDELSSHSNNPVQLSATCGIFGESELIGKIIEGHPLPSLCAGVNRTLIQRVAPMLRTMQSQTIVLTGGVAKNDAFRIMLAEDTETRVVVPKHPQYNGAIGCATLAR